MARSTKDAWLTGQGDLKEVDVEDVPVPGQSVRVRALSARYSAEVQGQLKMVTEGRSQVARIDTVTMERLQFQYGVIDPVFTEDEVKAIQENWGSAFRKVVDKVQEISGIDTEAVAKTEQKFRGGLQGQEGSPGGNGTGGPVDAVAAGDS